MCEIVLVIPDKTREADAHADRLELQLNRCRLPRCQKLLPPGRDFCNDAERSEWRRKFGLPELVRNR